MHEAYEPDAIIDLLHAEPLTGKDGRGVDLLSMHADATAYGDQDIASWKGYPTSGRPR